MFCVNCGAQLEEQAQFCHNCGTRTGAKPEQQNDSFEEQVAAREAQRLREIERLNNARQYFSQKFDLYNAHQRAREAVAYYGKGAKSVLLVFGCVVLGFGLTFSLICLAELDLESLVPMLLLFVAPGSGMLIGGILMKVCNRANYRRWHAEEARLTQQVYALCATYPDCPVEPMYTNPNILSILLQNLNTGRANTIQESLGLALAEYYQSGISRYLKA